MDDFAAATVNHKSRPPRWASGVLVALLLSGCAAATQSASLVPLPPDVDGQVRFGDSVNLWNITLKGERSTARIDQPTAFVAYFIDRTNGPITLGITSPVGPVPPMTVPVPDPPWLWYEANLDPRLLAKPGTVTLIVTDGANHQLARGSLTVVDQPV